MIKARSMRTGTIKLCAKGFSLLEVLIALVLLTIGFKVFLELNALGQYTLRQAELSSRIMDVAQLKMEETLAKSFSQLNANSTGNLNGVFWQVNIAERMENAIPYKTVEVLAADKPTNNPKRMEVRLENIVPCPFLNSDSKIIVGDETALVPFSPAPTNTHSLIHTSTDALAVDVAFKVKKSLMIIYNISIDQDDITGLDAADTIVTACFVDGVLYPIETKTPIVTQPLISNVLGVNNLSAGRSHRIEIRWYKDTPSGAIKLREANLIVIAFEKT